MEEDFNTLYSRIILRLILIGSILTLSFFLPLQLNMVLRIFKISLTAILILPTFVVCVAGYSLIKRNCERDLEEYLALTILLDLSALLLLIFLG